MEELSVTSNFQYLKSFNIYLQLCLNATERNDLTVSALCTHVTTLCCVLVNT